MLGLSDACESETQSLVGSYSIDHGPARSVIYHSQACQKCQTAVLQLLFFVVVHHWDVLSRTCTEAKPSFLDRFKESKRLECFSFWEKESFKDYFVFFSSHEKKANVGGLNSNYAAVKCWDNTVGVICAEADDYFWEQKLTFS